METEIVYPFLDLVKYTYSERFNQFTLVEIEADFVGVQRLRNPTGTKPTIRGLYFIQDPAKATEYPQFVTPAIWNGVAWLSFDGKRTELPVQEVVWHGLASDQRVQHFAEQYGKIIK